MIVSDIICARHGKSATLSARATADRPGLEQPRVWFRFPLELAGQSPPSTGSFAGQAVRLGQESLVQVLAFALAQDAGLVAPAGQRRIQ